MAQRRPHCRINGVNKELPVGDTLTAHAKFTGSTSTAFAINLGQTQSMTVTVSPAVAGNSLAAGEDITAQPTAALPNGVNIAWAYVSAANTVVNGFTSSALISASQPIAWRITAFR